jgi:hypothetical protein
MQRILILFTAIVLSFSISTAQTTDFQNKSKDELLQFIKESIETYGHFMGIKYRVSYNAEEPNHLKVGEAIEGDTKWYKVDISKASFGTSISILASGKENFALTFKKEITIKEKNNKNATLDVMFFRNKDKRETDYGDLIQNLTQAFTSLINKCRP